MMSFVEEYPRLTEDFLAITRRMLSSSPDVSDRIDIAVDMWHSYESALAVESVLDVIADPEDKEVQVLFADFCRLIYISALVGSTRYAWIDFAPDACLVTHE